MSVVRKRKPEPKEPPPPLIVVPSARFKRDLLRQKTRGKDLAKIEAVIVALSNRLPLEPKHRDHALTGDWAEHRDCHVEPDWVLIYQRTPTELRLVRTGTHSDLRLGG